MSQMTMTGRERGFLDAVLADPSDDFPRLVYADWLEDEGRVERSDFIRLQLEVDRLRPGPEEHRKASRLLERRRKGAPVRMKARPPATLLMREAVMIPQQQAPHPIFLTCQGWSYRRGFVASISLALTDFLSHAGAIFAAAPVECVSLSDREPLEGVWRLGGLSVCPGRTSYELTAQIYYLLTGKDHLGGKRYDDDAHAIAALSEACVWYGRRRAGLFPMRFRKEAAHP